MLENVFSGFVNRVLDNPEDGIYLFATDAFEVKAGSNGLPILSVHNKTRGNIKRNTMISLNFRNVMEQSVVFNEIRFITHRLKKCSSHFELSLFRVSFTFNTKTQTVCTTLQIKLDIHPQFYRYFSSDISAPLVAILNEDVIPYPANDDEFFHKYESMAKDAHLFYKVIADNTSRMPEELCSFQHPHLLTTLLPFQRKALRWLLDKEGVSYDSGDRKCVQKALIFPEFEESLRRLPNCDNVWLDEQIHFVLNRLCFGWTRVLFRDNVCWMNELTGNILTSEQTLDFLKDSIDSLNETPLPAQGLLSEEMGLGKTVEVVNLILLNPRPAEQIDTEIKLHLQKEGDIRSLKVAKTTLIAAPQPILHQWYNEITKFCPGLSVTIYRGLGKYPELANIPRYVGEYLRRFDIVLLNYSQLAAEANHANYTSRHSVTRGKKRSLHEANERASSSLDSFAATIDSFQAKFEVAHEPGTHTATMSLKHYEKEVLDELAAKIRKEDLSKIPHTQFYESPLMLSQWWRVVLDEVQMVSSGSSNAFETASLIPRYHSWGVSGTPSRLVAVLQFLRCPPFSYEISKFCWKKIEEDSSSNVRFVQLWLGLALRHTKAMVDDQIKLPPQKRILLTVPLTDVEQDKYTQMYESCLASIGIRFDRNQNPTRVELQPSDCVHLRSWLVKLRQLCGNLQIGNLSTAKGKGKKSKLMVSGFPELKTLGGVLSDMMNGALDEINECERGVLGRMLDVAQLLEYLLLPEMVIKLLDKGLLDINYLIRKQIESHYSSSSELLKKKAKLWKLKLLKKKDLAGLSDDEPDEESSEEEAEETNEDAPPDQKPRSAPSIVNMSEEEAEQEVISFKKMKDAVHQGRIRLRSLRMLQHKCYFLLASAHFQCYDEEYQKKISEKRVAFDTLSAIESNVIGDDILPHIGEREEEDYLADFHHLEGLGADEQKVEKHKHLESKFYDLAEQCRKEILKHAIHDAHTAVEKRITGKGSVEAKDWINDGTTAFSKTSRRLIKSTPQIKLDDLHELVGSTKVRQVLTQFDVLIRELNRQSDLIRDLVENLALVLCNPLLSDEKSPDGEEYEKSIEDQDHASSLMLVITQLLIDRSNATIEQKTKIDEMRKNQEKDFKMEARRLSDRRFLKQHQESRTKAKPKSDFSFEELLQDTRLIQNELDSINSPQASTFEEICLVLRTVFENEKSSQEMLHKEINTCYNVVFNARVEYFKQLQQISDSVQGKSYATSQDNLQPSVINAEVSSLLTLFTAARRRLTKGISKLRYLSTLVLEDGKEGKQPKDSQDECVICQSFITVGSLTPCGHKFCKACLDEWLELHKACPICKNHITAETVYHFTQYKSELKAQTVENGTHDNLSPAENLAIHSVYSQLDGGTLRAIHQIKLSHSFGSKVDVIVKQVLHLRSLDSDVQIVIFSQWQDLLAILTFAFDKAGISHCSAKGSHIAALKGKKDDPVEEFKSKKKTCFLLNAQAQASGLTLINATHIFLCEPLVNTPVELQAISRIHRIGQRKITTVWMFAIENSVEQNIVSLGTRNRIEYLESTKKETKEKQSGNKRQKVQKEHLSHPFEEIELKTAESYAMSLGMTSERSTGRVFSGNTESVADSDIPYVFFGERVNHDKEAQKKKKSTQKFKKEPV